ncbi:MAG: sigma-70 family RNA polymerase sigma factor [Planctomycetes bacterium]|nr:sigma-70 family RNA polymerase sigma factor [Planctomycetota bacterium]
MDQRQKQLLKLLDDNGGRLYALLYRLTLRYDVAEDLMQEMFIKLCDFKGFDDVKDLWPYARRVAINLAFDWRRKRANRFVGLDQVSESCSKEDGPVKKAVRQEQADRLLSAVSRLKGAFREIVVLRYLEQVSYEDIGKQIGKTPHHARSICHRARQQLRGMLSSNGSDGTGFGLEACNG